MSSAQLLDDEGNISDQVRLFNFNLDDSNVQQLELCLKHIFSKYCYPPVQRPSGESVFLTPSADAYLTAQGLDKWAYETNGTPFTKETKDELIEFLDVTDDGNLTYGNPSNQEMKSNK
jgi:hypothetical protein